MKVRGLKWKILKVRGSVLDFCQQKKWRHFLSNSTPSSYSQVGKHGNICTLNEIDIRKEGA